MSIWRIVEPMVQVQLLSADFSSTMAALGNVGIMMEDVSVIDQLHLRFWIHRKDLRRVKKIAQKRGDQLTVESYRGIQGGLSSLRKRPVFVCGILAVFLFSIWLPSRIFFIEVEGNAAIPARQIIEVASSCGIGFGASRRQVRSEKIKNALLEAMPQLQWAGVNTYGCRAVITVKERQQTDDPQTKAAVSSIVALRDGVIRQITVEKGNALVQPGQAIQQGQVLISGYTDCGICIQAAAAKGEVFGDTQRRMSAVLPLEYAQRGEILTTFKKYSLIIGKKRINFFKGSGISGATCAKIYGQRYLTLPGGFQLPVAIAVERTDIYRQDVAAVVDAQKILTDFTSTYLSKQMIAGTILHSSQFYFEDKGCVGMEGIYSCYEMIGITRPEEHLNE